MLRRKPASSGAPSLADASPFDLPAIGGGVLYAVGDIHGRSDLLDELLTTIRARDGHLDAGQLSVILLGDYVDRGAASKDVIERLCRLRSEGWCRLIALKGNHEDVMLSFLGGQPVGPQWITFGGAETLRSYGVPAPYRGSQPEDFEAARQALSAAMPAAHLAFLEQLELFTLNGDYLFVHAGVKPAVALEEQCEYDLMWIREEFGSSDRPSDKVVVYGHTPDREPRIERWKIGLDTGAYASGVLTALRLEGISREIVQIRHQPRL